MTLAALALALALALAPTHAPAPAPGGATRGPDVHWRGDELELDALPDELPEGAREALSYFAPWAAEHDFSLWLTEDARVLFASDSRKVSSREWKVLEETVAACDELFPLPPRGEEAARTETAEADADGDGGSTWSWGDVLRLEHDTAAFFRLSGKEEFRSLLDHVAEREGEDAGFAARYENLSGIVLHRPLAGVIVDNAPGVEEWEPMNELVNRLARMLLVRRFGRVPNWLTMGIAWHVEMSVRGKVFCFPHRTTFVGVAEHNGWEDALKKDFKKRNGPEVDLSRLVSWQRGTYDPVQAGRAWGTVSFVADTDPEALSLVLEDLRLLMERKGRVTHPDGTWELVPDFEPSPEDQLAVLRSRVHPEFTEALTDYFRTGMRAPRRR